MRARRRFALAMLAVSGCGSVPTGSPAERVEAAVLASRVMIGRFARQTAWHPCTVADRSNVVVRERCAAPPAPGTERFDEVERSVADVRATLGADSTPAVLHALALVELAWRDSDPAGVTRAVAKLEAASRRAPTDAVLLNDLAVGYLALAERDGQLQAMLRALDAVNRALACDSTLAAALFNRALLLDRLHLTALAGRAWTEYLAVETSDDWRAEAQGRSRRLATRTDASTWPDSSGPLLVGDSAAIHAALAARAARSGGGTREFGLTLLGDWGAAVARGDSVAAGRVFGATRLIASILDAAGADRSITHAVRAIGAADGQRRASLARGHARLGLGRKLFARSEFDSAVAALGEAERDLRRLGSKASVWAAYYLGAALVSRGDYEAGDRAFLAAIDDASADQPALIGKSMMGLGVSHVRRGHYESAITWYRRARPHVERARERDTEGWVAHLLAESLWLTGKPAESDREAYRALDLLSPFRRTNYLNNHLSLVAGVARRSDASSAALDVMDEVLEIARSLAKPDVLALALDARARDLIALGRLGEAESHLTEAERWTARMTEGRGLERIRAMVVLARGQIMRAANPRAALPVLERAVQAFERFGGDFHLPTALYEAAEAARASGDLHRARARLGEAIRLLERQQRTFQTAELRTAFSETVEKVFDAMIALELDAGRPASAFEYLERARAAATSVSSPAGRSRHRRTTFPRITDVGRRLPADVLLVEYALLGDRIAVWTVSRHGWRHTTVPVPRDSVRRLADRFLAEAALETAAAVDTRARLFDLLVRPIERDLRGATRVTTVGDRELYRIPFGALWDRGSRRYAIEAYEFRSAPSAAFLIAGSSARPARGPRTALVIGNPALSSGVDRGLPALPGARAEAERVARLYRHTSLLTGEGARRGRVLELLSTSSILHFAGHAVFDPDRPELSYLALAPTDSADDGILTAEEIARLGLSNLQFVVLSACSTASPRATRTGAVAGLAYSFLRAGAPATISTLWDVSDDVTTELLVGFHRHVARDVSPADALRRAQLDALRSTSPRLRVPSAWAAFTYTGP